VTPILKACLKTSWSEGFKTPPSESIETFTPVFPNGRIGTFIGSDASVVVLPRADDSMLKGITADPIPAAPARLIKSRLEKLPVLSDMLRFSFEIQNQGEDNIWSEIF
jgi:hypothetical protein